MPDTSWCILRTSGRLTLPLAESLCNAGLEAWAPVETIVFRVPRMNAKRTIIRPLMERYVFAAARHEADLIEITAQPRARHPEFRFFRDCDGEIRYVDDSELDPLREAEMRAVPRGKLKPYARGSEVRITAGPCEGLSGVIEKSNGRECELWVTLFGRHQRLIISTFKLKPIGVNGGSGSAMSLAA